MKPFFFKQFKIFQDKTAMKVGTDGVLLGAWAENNQTKSILDIGTGTGLIAIMQAQKNPTAKIIGLEIEENAFKQAIENIANSPWKNNITPVHSSLQNFHSNERFDLIISNPPFYNNTFLAKDLARNLARQNNSLSFEELLKHSASHLSKNGKACYILPFSEKINFISIAKRYYLFPSKILYIKGNMHSEIKRVLIAFSFTESILQEEIISIEISRHNYTSEYIALVEDFYFKM